MRHKQTCVIVIDSTGGKILSCTFPRGRLEGRRSHHQKLNVVDVRLGISFHFYLVIQKKERERKRPMSCRNKKTQYD